MAKYHPMLAHLYSESEYLEFMKDELRQAIEECEKIAVHPFRGFVYDSMRKRLKVIEEFCIQVAKHRDGDCRWLPIGRLLNQAHERAGHWLRNTVSKDAKAQAIPLFRKLADNLRLLHHQILELQHKATGQIGPILPKSAEAPLRQNKPVAVKLPSGLLIPQKAKLHV